jgi:5-methylcytosine-specific restriction endonuclease McrA
MSNNKWSTNIEPFLKEIRTWSKRGVSDKDIASNLGVGYSTLRKYIAEKEELKEAIRDIGAYDNEGPEEHETLRRNHMSQATYSGNVPRPDHEGAHRRMFEKNKKKILATQTVCGICGKPVNKSLKFPDPLAPCIDHIIPIVRGGHPSDINNLQLAHWCCNRQKSDKIMVPQEARPKQEVISNRVLPKARISNGHQPSHRPLPGSRRA